MKIAIVDDDSLYRDKLISLILNENTNIETDTFDSAEKFLSQDIYQYSIVFLDIEMPNIDGVSLAAILRKRKSKALIFFVTSHSNYITSALKSVPFQYLIKPIDEKIFKEEFERAIRLLTKRKKEIQITWNGEKSFIKIDSIEYVEYCGRNLVFSCNDSNVYESKGRLKDYGAKLAEYDFVQTHNSFLVNLSAIYNIKLYEVVLKNGKSIPISKKFYNDMREKFRVYISGVAIC